MFKNTLYSTNNVDANNGKQPKSYSNYLNNPLVCDTLLSDEIVEQ